MAGDHRLYLDDLKVGQRFESATREVSIEDVMRFAREFDPQPFHLDDAAARGTMFGGLAASGWHTAALTMRLLTESIPLANGIIGAGGEISWPQPTRPGDRLHAVSEITAIRPSKSRPGRGIVQCRSETRNQAGEVVQVLVSNLVVWRSPEAVDAVTG